MATDGGVDNHSWQRTSKWATLPYLLQAAWQWGGVIAGGTWLSYRQQDYLPWLMLLLGLGLPTLAFLRWRFTEFRFTNQGVELRQGLLAKKLLLLPQSRVQELQLEQPAYFRPWQLTNVTLDSAGSKQQEFALFGLRPAQLSHLLGQATAVQPARSGTAFSRIWLATLYNKQLWLPLLAVVGASQSFWWDHSQQIWRQLQAAWQINHSLWLLPAALLLCAGVLALLALIWLYPQHLQHADGRWQLQQGSVLKKSLQIKADMLQMLSVKQPWLAQLFGHYSVWFYGFVNQQQAQSKFVLLGQDSNEVLQLLPQALSNIESLTQLPGANSGLQRFAPAYFRLRWGYWLVAGLPLTALGVAGYWLLDAGVWLAVAAAVGWLYWGLQLALRQRWHGFSVDNNLLMYWQGGLSQSWQWLPLSQLQQVDLQQTPYLRRHQLVQVVLATANGSVCLAAIPNGQAAQLYQQLLEHLQPREAG